MIQSMILRQREGRYDLKDLEGVLPVLDRRLYDGGDGGVVLYAGLRAEASADLELGLRGTEGLSVLRSSFRTACAGTAYEERL